MPECLLQERGKNEDIEDWKKRLESTKEKQNYINLGGY